jgi:hypothetical protein
LRFGLSEHPDGVETEPGNRVVYDVARNEAHFGASRVDGPALVWELGGDAAGSALWAEVELDPGPEWIARCDRIDFPPGGVAYLHTHPGPGIRRLLFGSLRIDTEGRSTTYGPGGAWFESGPSPVYAAASETEDSAFVRVMLLPREWEGKRTIAYVNPEDAEKPKLQRATVLFDRVLGTGPGAWPAGTRQRR